MTSQPLGIRHALRSPETTLRDRAIDLSWLHTTSRLSWSAKWQGSGERFQSDVGFVPQVGYTRASGRVGFGFSPRGFVSFLQPLAGASMSLAQSGETLGTDRYIGLRFLGRWGSLGEAAVHPREQVRTDDGRLLDTAYTSFNVGVQPGRRLPRLLAQVRVGSAVDGARPVVGHGGRARIDLSLRPLEQIGIDVAHDWDWLDDSGGRTPGRSRIHRATGASATVVVAPNVRGSVRVVGRYERTQRWNSPFDTRPGSDDGSWSAMLLATYRVGWRTALHVGLGNSAALEDGTWRGQRGAGIFTKVSYEVRRR